MSGLATSTLSTRSSLSLDTSAPGPYNNRPPTTDNNAAEVVTMNNQTLSLKLMMEDLDRAVRERELEACSSPVANGEGRDPALLALHNDFNQLVQMRNRGPVQPTQTPGKQAHETIQVSEKENVEPIEQPKLHQANFVIAVHQQAAPVGSTSWTMAGTGTARDDMVRDEKHTTNNEEELEASTRLLEKQLQEHLHEEHNQYAMNEQAVEEESDAERRLIVTNIAADAGRGELASVFATNSYAWRRMKILDERHPKNGTRTAYVEMSSRKQAKAACRTIYAFIFGLRVQIELAIQD
ncbi:hypothetical protein BU24DRAFT_422248 [Aaosphaeria arxii CBS 175.79]|uniref:RRM domain-containing protein n=1 Tax=Aaosphaeria arxii CBS 175.79 TaxID=1450172 RepID=A0A6A5XUL7_9PLEO|nr:uncharacterized protein BU24DRAFT_422248 [Aaosphaeria arxii CBS 175.79]KAF2015934.1 hypothetical protein BU24DRAFT_422248 [Aaosphaeria arxii CBS 175.79]